MNKNIQNNSNCQQVVLTEVAVYNLRVKEYLSKTQLTHIEQLVIKQFKARAQRNKFTELHYNKEVEIFNATHGLLLLKKGKEQVENTKYYAYINRPYLNREAVNKTMDNYRAFRDKYNGKAKKYSIEVVKPYNKEVVKATDVTVIAKINDFKEENKKLKAEDYNAKVEALNTVFEKRYVRKKNIQRIHQSLNEVFNVFVGFYAGQLKKRNADLINDKKPTSVAKNNLPKLKINIKTTAGHKQNGNKRLDISVRGLQNMITRFKEVGLIENYLFLSKNRPVYFNLNPKIVCILDGKPPKLQPPVKPSFNPSETKKVHNHNHFNKTCFIKKIKKDDCVNTDQDKCGSTPHKKESTICLADGYKVTKRDNQTKKISTAEIKDILPDFLKKKVIPPKKRNEYANFFLKNTLKTTVFAEKLANGDYDDYSGVRYEQLQSKLIYAKLSFQEKREFLVQIVLKSAAKIWRNHLVYKGDWINTIKNLNKVLFANCKDAESMILKLREYRWKLNYARKWFMHSDVNALYPSLYFDTARKNKKQVGFFGLHPAWEKHVKRENETKRARKKRKLNTNLTLTKIKNDKYFDKILQKYLTNEISLSDLKADMKRSLPASYFNKIPALIAIKN